MEALAHEADRKPSILKWPAKIQFYRKYPNQYPWAYDASRESQGDWRETEVYVPLGERARVEAEREALIQALCSVAPSDPTLKAVEAA